MQLGRTVGVLALAGATSAIAIARRPGMVARRVPVFAEEPVTIVGHRGARGHAPENTLLGLRRGLELGAHALEIDVRLSSDGHVVLMHDPRVERTTDGSGPVAAHTLAELRLLDAGYRWRDQKGAHPFRGLGLTVPTLAEVFAHVPDAFLVLELKREPGFELATAVVDEITRAGRQDSVLVASAATAPLEVVRAALPGVPTNLGDREATSLYRLRLVGMYRRWRGDGRVLQVPEVHRGRRVVTPRFVAAAHELGLDVQVWTVNNPETMRRLLDWGVDGLVTDYPDLAAEVVAAAAASRFSG